MKLASIITYNPEISRLKLNIFGLLNQVDQIVIIDNNSLNINELEKLMLSFENIKIIKNEFNKGIAEALNQALDYANKNSVNWLLTLDQDSIVCENMLTEYMNFIEQSRDEKIGIISPIILDDNINEDGTINNGYKFVDMAITSGSFVNVKIANHIGGFEKKLFIDYVDFDFCMKLKLKGYKIVRLNSVILRHMLGEREIIKFLKFKINLTNHNPIRRYYLFRNKIYFYNKYIKNFPKICFRNILSTLKVLFKIVIFEKNRIENLKFIIKGIKDSKRLIKEINDES